jgi:hypothetical protein
MTQDSWNSSSPDGKTIKYDYKELADGIAAISKKEDGKLLMILQRSVRAPLTREEVEIVFEQTPYAGRISM